MPQVKDALLQHVFKTVVGLLSLAASGLMAFGAQLLFDTRDSLRTLRAEHAAFVERFDESRQMDRARLDALEAWGPRSGDRVTRQMLDAVEDDFEDRSTRMRAELQADVRAMRSDLRGIAESVVRTEAQVEALVREADRGRGGDDL